VTGLALVLAATTAAAEEPDWTLKLEAGSEVDSNVHRAPSGSDVVGAADGRLGVRYDISGRAGDAGRFAFDAVGAVKGFAGADASSEDVGVAAADLRFDWLVGAVVPGVRASYYEAFGADDNALALRTADAAGSLGLVAGDLRVLATAGWRTFTYKPDGSFDFDGPHAGLSVGQRFHSDDASRQLTWGVAYSAGVRRYSSPALANFCPPDMPVAPSCLAVTAQSRSDLFHDLAAELTYTSTFIVGLRLGLQINDSNSFAQSLVRGRGELSGTALLPGDFVVTAKLVLQVDAYVDGLLLGGDVGTFTTIEDEARNALILHITRDLTDNWTLEARLAAYQNAFAADAIAYSRQTAYLGLVYAFERRK